MGDKITDDVIHFDHLNPGSYTAYAYANIDAHAWQKSGEEADASGQEIDKTSGSFSSFLNRKLDALVSGAPITPSGAGESSMLLTGKATVPVSLTVKEDTLRLQRPVVRFRVYVHNTTSYPVRVDQLSFSHFNANKAYLVDHSAEDGVPVMPDDVDYGALPAYPNVPAASPAIRVAPEVGNVSYEEEYLVYETLLYENASPNAYKVFATLTLDPSGSAESTLSLGQRDFGVIDYETLAAMDEGENVDVLVVNPQISVRSGRIFTHLSADSHMAWESAGHSSAAQFFGRAQAIWNQDASYDYSSRYSYSNANGYSAWTGLNADDPSTATSFSYTGKRSQYFHNLSKQHDGTFTLDGLATSNNSANGTLQGTSITGILFEKGKYVKDKIPADIDADLIRFKRSDNKYIQCNTNWSNSVPHKESVMMWQGGGTNQDRQFVLYGQYCAGGMLKRIQSDTHKEVPLTYMSRNEDIKLVLNVYYADQAATMDFEVDNSDWETPVVSTHTFN